jgi:hypothetical protein
MTTQYPAGTRLREEWMGNSLTFDPKSSDATHEAAGRRAVAATSEAGAERLKARQDALTEGKADTARRTAAPPKTERPRAVSAGKANVFSCR